MTKIRLSVLIAFIAIVSSCSSHEFDILDKTLEKSGEYEKFFSSKADSLKYELMFALSDSSRWEMAQELYNHYKRYSIDSTSRYLSIMESCCPDDRDFTLTTKLSKVWNLIHLGRHLDAVRLFETLTLPDDADPELVSLFFTTGYDCYSQNFGDASFSPDYPAKYVANALRYWQRDSTSVSSVDIHSRFIRRGGNVKEAIRLLESIAPESMSPTEYAQIEHHLGEAYRILGDEQKYKQHLVNAACQDLRNSSKIYVSLYYLSEILLQEDDLKRANRYVDKAIHDAIQCNYIFGIKRGAALGLAVNDELNSVEHRKKMILVSFLISSIIIAIAILMLLLRINVLMLKLKKDHSELEHKTVLLDEASRIKDGFLATSLEMAASYINQVDEEKKTMRRILKKDGIEALAANLRSPSYSDSEHVNFNAKFDRTFISLFPTFVDELNALMRDEKRFELESNGSLTTELRILALIRLGIDESSRIARILFISKGTVYTYRCNMRMAAKCKSEEFEDMVRRLGNQV